MIEVKEKVLYQKFGVLKLIIIVQSFLFIFFFPNLESPDALYHVKKLFGGFNYSKEFYFKVMNNVKLFAESVIGQELTLKYSITGKGDYFSLESIVNYSISNTTSIILFQICNILLVFLSIYIFEFIVNKDKKVPREQKTFIKKINYLYFIYPQTAYLITTITPDFFNFLIQPIFLYFLYTKRYITNLLIILVIYSFCDEGIITNLLFMISYLSLSRILKMHKSKRKTFWLFGATILLAVIFYFSRNLLGNLSTTNSLVEISTRAIENNGTFSTKVVNFILSSFCFWGIGNFITLPIFYALYIYTVAYVARTAYKSKLESDKKFWEVLFSLFSTVSLVLIFFGTHSNIRFFMYWIPIILLGYMIYLPRKRYLKKINSVTLATIFFFHNVLLIFFYGIKIFVLI